MIDQTAAGCTHTADIADVPPPSDVCDECVAVGSTWFHLRQCLICGKMGCCDQSPKKHATRHYRAEGHPIMRSAEPDEDWAWCFVDRLYVGGSDV